MTKDPPTKSVAVSEIGPTGRGGDFETELGLQLRPLPGGSSGPGGTATYSGVRMRPGDIIRWKRDIVEYSERQGRMGLQLYTTISDRLLEPEGGAD